MSEIQKNILNQTGVSQSQYLQNIAALHSHIDNTNEGIKNASYERYLNRKKGKVISNQGKTVASEPSIGNKTQSVSLTSKVTSDCATNLCN
jgi:hypothetical protein